MNKRLYIGFSFFELIWTILLRLACVFGLIYSLSHYDENPVVIIIVSAFCILSIFIIGDDKIIVYQDNITQTTNSFASLIFKQKARTYYIDQIKSACLQPSSIFEPTEFRNYRRGNKVRGYTQPLFFVLKSGRVVNFDTYLETRKLKRIVEIVNSLTK